MVLATHHVGDLRIEIVDGDGEVVEHRAVRPGDDGVVHVQVLEARLTADGVVDDRRALIPHAQPHGPGVLRLAPVSALGAV